MEKKCTRAQAEAVRSIRAMSTPRRFMVSTRPALCGWVEIKGHGETWLVAPDGRIVRASSATVLLRAMRSEP